MGWRDSLSVGVVFHLSLCWKVLGVGLNLFFPLFSYVVFSPFKDISGRLSLLRFFPPVISDSPRAWTIVGIKHFQSQKLPLLS